MSARLGFLVLISALLLCGANVYAAEAPKFTDYKAKLYGGSKSAVRLDTAREKKYKTRLRKASSEQVNFGGHYILTHWEERGCEIGAIIDVRTGEAQFLPFTTCGASETETPFEFRSDSRLIVIKGRLEDRDAIGVRYFAVNKGKFTKVFEKVFARKRNDGFLAALFSGRGDEDIEPSAGPRESIVVNDQTLRANPTIGPLLYCYDEGLKGKIGKLMSESQAHSSDERIYVFRMLLAGGVVGLARDVKSKCDDWYLSQAGIRGDKAAIISTYGALFGEYAHAEEGFFLQECVRKRGVAGWENLSVECEKSIVQ